MNKNRMISILLSAMIIPCNYTTFNHSYNDIMITADAVDIIASGTQNQRQISWSLDSEGTLTISGTGGIDGDYYQGHKDDIKKVIIEPGITNIYSSAFENFSNLISVDIPDTVTSIGVAAFQKCTSLTSVDLPKQLETIDVFTFKDCTNLKTVSIPNSVTTINQSVFYRCSSLESIEIPDSVTKIDDYAFSQCSSLESIKLPRYITRIGYYEFEFCTNLKNIEIPDTISFIGTHAFYKCQSLESITVPASVSTIQEDAFNRCGDITLTILNPKCKIYYKDNFVTDEYDDFPSVIKGYKGSTAEAYAQKFNRTFIALDDDSPVTTVVTTDAPTTTTSTSSEAPDNSNEIGDANGDGRIDAKDASAILAYYSYLSTASDDVMSLAEFLNSK